MQNLRHLASSLARETSVLRRYEDIFIVLMLLMVLVPAFGFGGSATAGLVSVGLGLLLAAWPLTPPLKDSKSARPAAPTIAEPPDTRTDSTQTPSLNLEGLFGPVKEQMGGTAVLFSVLRQIELPFKIQSTASVAGFPRHPHGGKFKGTSRSELSIEAQVKGLTRKDPAVSEFVKREYSREQRRRELAHQISNLELAGTFRDVRRRFPGFNNIPATRKSLEDMLKADGVHVRRLSQPLPLLSALVFQPTENGGHALVALRADDRVHPFVQDFVLAHEVGHWHLHFCPLTASRSNSKPEDRFIEYSTIWDEVNLSIADKQADAFALLAFFPTPELMNLEAQQPLTPDLLVRTFVEPRYPEFPISERFRTELHWYAQERLRIYRKHLDRQLREPARIAKQFIRQDQLKTVLDLLGQDRAWGVLDGDSLLVDFSTEFAALLGVVDPESIRGKSARDFVTARWQEYVDREIAVEQARHVSRFFAVGYKHTNGSEVLATVYALPILDSDDHYAGSLGIVQGRS